MKFNETNLNSHWPLKKLNQLGEFKRGKSKHRPRNDNKLFNDGTYPLIQTGDIKAADLYINEASEFYNDFGLSQSKLWDEGTLCITIAANIAETAILNEKMCFPDSVVGFVPYRDKSTSHFVHYLFAFIRQRIQNSIQGSIQDNINIEYLEKLELRIPEYTIQQKIAAVLSTLDHKITLNNKINTELEAMAKTLYEYWFVQFDFPDTEGKPYKSTGGKMAYDALLKREIPEGWEVKRFGDLVKSINTGLNPRDHFKLGNGENFYITIKNIEYGIIKFDHSCDKIDDDSWARIQKRSKLEKGDVLFTSIEPVGKTYLLHENPSNWNINESVFSLKPNLQLLTSEYLFMLASGDEMKFKCKNSSTGSIHKGIRITPLKEFSFCHSPYYLIEKFTKKINPILSKIDLNQKQNQELVQLRDWLLPMLMNGQVMVVEGHKTTEDNVFDMVAEPELIYNKTVSVNKKVSNDDRFKLWLSSQKAAARGGMDEVVLREIFDAMDYEDQ